MLAVVATGLVLAACSSSPGSSTVPATGRPLVSVPGGTVTVELPTIPTNLNAGTVAGDDATTAAVASAIWPQAFTIGPNLQPALVTDLLQSAQVVSVNPLTVVYQINPKAVWSDGVPITANDFVADWRAHVGAIATTTGPDAPSSTIGYRDIASVTGSAKGRTVTVVFRIPFADWSSLFDDLVPAHVVARGGWGTSFTRDDPAALVSGGPWLVGDWRPGEELVLVHNPRWWGSAPTIGRLVLKRSPGTQLDVADLRDDLAQVASTTALTPSTMAAVSSATGLRSLTWPGTTVLQLEFNVDHFPVDTAPVRQAIAHSINRTAMVDDLVSPVAPTVVPNGDHLLAPSQPGYHDDGAAYEGKPDLAAVQRLLTAAGLTQDAAGTWAQYGTPVTLHLVWASDDPWSAEVGPVVEAQLVQAGFDVDAAPVPTAQLDGSVLPTGQFDLALVPVAGQAYTSQMERVFSTVDGVGGAGGSLDWMGYDSPHVDNLFAQAAQQLNGATEQGVYQQVDVALWNDMPSLPLFAEPNLTVTAIALLGVHPLALGPGILWDTQAWTYVAAGRRGEAPATTLTLPSQARGAR